MNFVRRTTAALPVMLLATALLGGCGFFSRHLDRQDDTYKQSAQSRPLEVPPDLDSPASNAALTIPDARPTAAAPASAAAPAGGSPPAMSASPTPGSAPPSTVATPGVVPTGDGLLVSDSLESTYRRVGLALERSGAARVLGSDAAAHSYEVETTGQTTIKPGWFKRAVTFGRAGNKVTSQVRLGVTVEQSAQGSRVRVGGGSDDASREAAQALLQVLRERLS
jgi:uncharacterized lipoprotein